MLAVTGSSVNQRIILSEQKCINLSERYSNGVAEKGILEQNKVYADLSQKHPDRIISFFSIDPERDNAAKSFRTAVTMKPVSHFH